MRYCGPVAAADARQFLPLYTQIGQQHGQLRLLLDLAHAVGPSPETRREMAAWHPDGFACWVIYFNASFINRGSLQIVHAAMRLVGNSGVDVVTFGTEEQALAFWKTRVKK